MDVEKAGPTHCSGREAKAMFKESYGNNCISIGAGQILNV
jgi:metal-dependent hydrolase (beta-lactamase superfamily II)